jgi:alkylglycerol monooxygenase
MIIAFSIPVFFVLICIEFFVAKRQKRKVFRFNDAVTDLSCGIGNQVTGVFMDAGIFAIYIAVYNNIHLIDFSPSSAVTWVVATIAVDFAYYWWHRSSHRVNCIWAGHIVHHQSQDYNLAVALRQAWFTRCTIWAFNLPLAFLGIPPLVFAISTSINTLYQFWIHTETIGKLGILERVLNTPSHHRVHHGVNPKYIDKNYAGIFIIWDRLFGTFCEENEDVVYGTVKPFKSLDPIWANFHYWIEMARMCWQAPQIRDKLKVLLMPPEWNPTELGGSTRIPPVTRQTFKKWNPQITNELAQYVGIQFAAIVISTMVLLFIHRSSPAEEVAALAVCIVASTWIWGHFFRGRRWAKWLEHIRIISIPLVCFFVVTGEESALPALVFSGVFAIVSEYWLFFRSHTFWILSQNFDTH